MPLLMLPPGCTGVVVGLNRQGCLSRRVIAGSRPNGGDGQTAGRKTKRNYETISSCNIHLLPLSYTGISLLTSTCRLMVLMVSANPCLQHPCYGGGAGVNRRDSLLQSVRTVFSGHAHPRPFDAPLMEDTAKRSLLGACAHMSIRR